MEKRVTYDIDIELVEGLKRAKEITKIPIKHHLETALREYLARFERPSKNKEIQVKTSKSKDKPSKNKLLEKINQLKEQ